MPGDKRLKHMAEIHFVLGLFAGYLASAALGKAQPLKRAAVVFVLSPILGIFFAIASNARSTERVFIIVSMLLYSVALLVSLFVVRSCGYRFVRCETP